jgi:hypothetical protein
MSTLLVAAIQDVAGAGSKATLPITGSNFTLGPNWGAWEWVSRTGITAVTNIDITSLAAGYDYIVSVRAALPATDNQMLHGRMSQSGTFMTDASDYNDDGGADTQMRLQTNGNGNTTYEATSFDALLYEPNVGSQVTTVACMGNMGSIGNQRYTPGHGGGCVAKNTNACDGLRMYWASGDWQATGEIQLYRRRVDA